MVERRPSWRTVAEALAARMRHQAYCRAHPEEPDADNDCPFCADRAAYQLFEQKTSSSRQPPEARHGG